MGRAQGFRAVKSPLWISRLAIFLPSSTRPFSFSASCLVAPEAAIVGVAGNGFTVTVVPAEVADVQFPLLTETL